MVRVLEHRPEGVDPPVGLGELHDRHDGVGDVHRNRADCLRHPVLVECEMERFAGHRSREGGCLTVCGLKAHDAETHQAASFRMMGRERDDRCRARRTRLPVQPGRDERGCRAEEQVEWDPHCLF